MTLSRAQYSFTVNDKPVTSDERFLKIERLLKHLHERKIIDKEPTNLQPEEYYALIGNSTAYVFLWFDEIDLLEETDFNIELRKRKPKKAKEPEPTHGVLINVGC